MNDNIIEQIGDRKRCKVKAFQGDFEQGNILIPNHPENGFYL